MNNINEDKKVIAVLGYHKIGESSYKDWTTWSYVSESTFFKQLDYLKNNNWHVLNVDEFVKGIASPEALPEKSVLITFDDGYRSTLTSALPVLRQSSFPAVVFVPTAFVGGYNAFDADIMYEPKEEMCNWDELCLLDENNVSVESHGDQHKHFSKLGADEQFEEITLSKKILEENLNKSVKLFSFPYGDNGLDKTSVEELLTKADYAAGFLYGGNPFTARSVNKLAIPRVPVGPDTDLDAVLKVLSQ